MNSQPVKFRHFSLSNRLRANLCSPLSIKRTRQGLLGLGIVAIAMAAPGTTDWAYNKISKDPQQTKAEQLWKECVLGVNRVAQCADYDLQLRSVREEANLHTGPGINYHVLMTLDSGEQVWVLQNNFCEGIGPNGQYDIAEVGGTIGYLPENKTTAMTEFGFNLNCGVERR